MGADIEYHQRPDFQNDHIDIFTKSKNEVAKVKNLYLQDERRALHIKFLKETAIHFELVGFEIHVSWRNVEYVLMLLYLVFFISPAIKALSLVGYVKTEMDFQRADRFFSKPVSTMFEYINDLANLIRNKNGINQAIFIFCIISFFVFNALRLLLIHYGVYADSSRLYRKITWIVSSATIFSMAFLFVMPDSQTDLSTMGRRRVIMQITGLLFASIIPVKLMEKAPHFVSVGLVLNPRYRKKSGVFWHAVSLRPGLYRNVKSKKLYFVNHSKMLRAHDKIEQKNLEPVHGIHEGEFENFSRLTADLYFEDQALHLLNSGKLTDALALLELGCKYQIYSVLNNNKPNIRLFKLYFGLCCKYRRQGHLKFLKEEIKRHKLEPSLQPFPQKWLLSKAWCFKSRWYRRVEYNNHKLT